MIRIYRDINQYKYPNETYDRAFFCEVKLSEPGEAKWRESDKPIKAMLDLGSSCPILIPLKILKKLHLEHLPVEAEGQLQGVGGQKSDSGIVLVDLKIITRGDRSSSFALVPADVSDIDQDFCTLGLKLIQFLKLVCAHDEIQALDLEESEYNKLQPYTGKVNIVKL